MSRLHYFTCKQRRGVALLLVMFVAFASLVLLTTLLTAIAPRHTSVSEEAVSDRALAASDGAIDYILNQVDAFPASLTGATLQTGLTNINTKYGSDQAGAKKAAVKYVMGYLLAGVNGGGIYQPLNDSTTAASVTHFLGADYTNYAAYSTNYVGAGTSSDQSIWNVEDNVATYLYNIGTQTYYAVWTTTTSGTIAPVTTTGPTGDITTKPIGNLATGLGQTGIAAVDPNFAADNQWIEVDVNTQYDDAGSGKVRIRASAYLLSSSNTQPIVRSIVVEGPLTVSATVNSSSGTASGPFQYAIYSGRNVALYQSEVVQTGSMSGGVYKGDGAAGEAKMFAVGLPNDPAGMSPGINITKSSTIVYGDVATSGPVSYLVGNAALGSASVKGTSLYSQPASTLPDYPSNANSTAKTDAMGTSNVGGSRTAINSSSSINIHVNGLTGGTAYYVAGSVSLSGLNNTISLVAPPNPGASLLDWYIDGDLTINGVTTIDFGTTHGIIWVNDNIHISKPVVIKGSGTIVAMGKVESGVSAAILVDGGAITYATDDSRLALIDEDQATTNGGIILRGVTVYSTLYAPHNSITFNNTGNLVFGSVVASGDVTIDKSSSVVYDTILSSGGSNIPPLPGSGSVSVNVSGLTSRSSWKEAIGVPVTYANIANVAKSTLVFSSGG